jgi:hypothetical protein
MSLALHMSPKESSNPYEKVSGESSFLTHPAHATEWQDTNGHSLAIGLFC